MKLSLDWLKDYIDLKLTVEALMERLTMAGLEVESIDYIGKDIVLEIEITPNRPDCLSILGLAREIGAITGKVVKYPKIKNPKTGSFKNFIHIENKKDCSRYIGTVIRDVRINDAPQGMRQRLSSLGIHAVNNAVDVTNFVLMESGQPMHAFDYDKLVGGKIIVRRAKAAESIVTLDGVERKLDPSILVIADAQKPVAIAGVMGGKGTEITAGTKNILLESAHFDMGIIRRASRSLGLQTASSYRFERNVNFDGVLTGADRATDLLLQLTGGQLAGRAQIEVKNTGSSRKLKVKVSGIESLLGVKTTHSKVKTSLARLGFKVTGKADVLTVVVPNNRTDIGQDADVIEEIARMIGFDQLPSKLPTINTHNIPVDKRPREIKDHIRRILTAAGIDEIITYSTISTKALIKTNMADIDPVRIFNPLSLDQEILRSKMLPAFLQVVTANINRGQKDLRFFEMGRLYYKEREQAKEKECLGILLSKKETIDFFDLKGVTERIFQVIGVKAVYNAIQEPRFDPACAASITVDGKQVGILGRLDRKVLNSWDIKNQDVYFSGIRLDEILSRPDKFVRYQPISEFPAVVRDVSLAVRKEIPYKRIEEICLKQGGEILRSVQFIEQYLGDKIQPGLKGLVFSCQYQSNIRTLREDEVSAVHERILQALVADLGAVRR